MAAALFLAMLVVSEAQDYTYTITNSAVTITGYTGSGGAVAIPSTITGLQVISIGNSAFATNDNLTSVTMPDSITNIGDFAFYGCGGLTNITISDSLSIIGASAFQQCLNLTSVAIPDSVTSIGSFAFYYCAKLDSVAISSGVTNIGDGAFSFCTNLAAIAVDALNPLYIGVDGVLFAQNQTVLVQFPAGKAGAYTIPSNVTNMGAYAFAGCVFLTNVTIPPSITSLEDYVFSYCASLKDVVIPSSVANIGDFAFFSCNSLGGVAIPNSVTNIGNFAFFSCPILAGVTIPSSIASIGDCAFYGCINLSGVVFQGNAPGLGSDVFSTDTNALTYYPPESTGWGPTFAGLPTTLYFPPYPPVPYTYTTNIEAISITKYIGFGGVAAIPATINGLPVTSLAGGAFEGSPVSSLTISGGVTNIGPSALASCTSLTNVTLGSGVTGIGDDAFDGCASLNELYFQGNAPSLGSNVFSGDGSATVYFLQSTSGWGPTFGGLPAKPLYQLISYNYTTNNGAITITKYTGSGGPVIIPGIIDGVPVTSIAAGAFENAGITSVTISNGVGSIGDAAFEGCASLTNLVIAGSVTNIGSFAFFLCSNLAGLTLPNSVAVIGTYAFSECSGLPSVTIGDGLGSVGNYAFSYDTSLSELYFQGNAPSLGSYVFTGGGNATVYFLPGRAGWGPKFGDLTAVLWNPVAQAMGMNFGEQTNGFGFAITGAANLMVVVEACTNLARPVWAPIQTNILTGGASDFSDLQWTNFPARFYHLSMP